jgi:hypothetical protein
MTKHRENAKRRRHRKLSKGVKFKTISDRDIVSAVKDEEVTIGTVAHLVVTPGSSNLSMSKQLDSPAKSLDPSVPSLLMKSTKKRKRKKSAIDKSLLGVASSQNESTTTSVSSNDLAGTFVWICRIVSCHCIYRSQAEMFLLSFCSVNTYAIAVIRCCRIKCFATHTEERV